MQLHNNLISDPLTVDPIVYASDGTKLPLSSVNLAPLGNATIDIGAQLAAIGSKKLSVGSAVFQYRRKNAGALSAEIYAENTATSLSFTIPSTDKPSPSRSQYAVFWLPSSGAEVYVALQNTSDQIVKVTPSISVNGRSVSLAAIPLAPHGSSVFYVSGDSNMFGGAWKKGSVGGITLVQDGPASALNTGGWIEDDDLGYSTTMTFADSSGKDTRLLGTQILIGKAGNSLNLPSDFVISSQLVLRNLSDQPMDVHGSLAFSDNGALAKASLESLHLAAGEIRGIDLSQAKSTAGIPDYFVSASISLQYSGVSGALMGRVFGVSQDGSYGLYWALQPSAGSSYSESFWSTDGNWTPILTVGNFGTVDDKITVVLTSNRGNFTMPAFGLKPSESNTINIRDLLNRAKPFPDGVNYGGLRIYGSSSDSQLVVKEHLIDPARRLATPFYGMYVYCLGIGFNPAVFSVVVGANVSGKQELYMSDSSIANGGNLFWSNNTSTATITGSFGNVTVTGVAAGSTYVNGQIRTTCDGFGNTCQFNSLAQANVQCAVPTNYHQTQGIDNGNGTLFFAYVWSSSTGNLSDLGACVVNEFVTYPGYPGPPTYTYPSPPFPASLSVNNPDTGAVNSGMLGVLFDNHSTPGTFVTPFPIGTTPVTARQVYLYTCPCANGGSPVQLYPAIPGNISIDRTVTASSSTSGTYSITKSGVSSNKAVP